MGLRVTPWMSMPARPSAVPARRPMTVRGTRSWSTTLWSASAGSGEVSASHTCAGVDGPHPETRLAATISTSAARTRPSPTPRARRQCAAAQSIGSLRRKRSLGASRPDLPRAARSLEFGAAATPVPHERDLPTVEAGLAHEEPTERGDHGRFAGEPRVAIAVEAAPLGHVPQRRVIEIGPLGRVERPCRVDRVAAEADRRRSSCAPPSHARPARAGHRARRQRRGPASAPRPPRGRAPRGSRAGSAPR